MRFLALQRSLSQMSFLDDDDDSLQKVQSTSKKESQKILKATDNNTIDITDDKSTDQSFEEKNEVLNTVNYNIDNYNLKIDDTIFLEFLDESYILPPPPPINSFEITTNDTMATDIDNSNNLNTAMASINNENKQIDSNASFTLQTDMQGEELIKLTEIKLDTVSLAISKIPDQVS
jgi:hypothetical protein